MSHTKSSSNFIVRSRNVVQLLVGLSAVVFVGVLRAQTTTWTAPSSGLWSNPTNWSAGLPNRATAVAITNGGSKVITVDAGTSAVNLGARRVDLRGYAGDTNTLYLSNLGADLFFLSNSFALDVGGRLVISNANLLVDGALGGNFNGFAGELVLGGGSLQTTNKAVVRIGRDGVGRATVHAGLLAAEDDLVIGGLPGADGLLLLLGGGVQCEGQLQLGDDPGAVGRMIIDGGTLTSTNDVTYIGDDGEGVMTMRSGVSTLWDVSVGRATNSLGLLRVEGGTLVTDSLSIGRFPTATGAVEVVGGLLSLPTSSLYVGREGVGTMRVSGGTVQSGSLSVGRKPAAQGTLTVDGGVVDLPGNNLYVGREGDGTVVFSNGTINAGNVLIAASNSASGLLRLEGGQLNVGQLLATRAAAQLQFNAGEVVVSQSSTVATGSPVVVGDGTRPAVLQLDGGIHSFADGLVISSNATLRGSGSVVGSVTVLPGGVKLMGLPAPVALTPVLVEGQLRLTWPSEAGHQYDVEMATQAAGGVWQSQATVPGTGGLLSYTNTTTGSPRFFRLFVH